MPLQSRQGLRPHPFYPSSFADTLSLTFHICFSLSASAVYHLIFSTFLCFDQEEHYYYCCCYRHLQYFSDIFCNGTRGHGISMDARGRVKPEWV